MRLASYRSEGRNDVGVLDEHGRLAPISVPFADGNSAMRTLLQQGPVYLVEATRAALAETERIELAATSLLPTVPDPQAIWCAAGTYRAHLREGGHKETSEPPWFLRLRESLCGPGGTIVRPRVSERLDYEGELAVIMGRRGRHIGESDAMSYIAGFTCFNDASVRDWQFHSTQVTAGKNFASTGVLGPWLVTLDEFGDPYTKRIVTRLNGTVVQSFGIGELMFTIEHMIAYISTICPLLPGDVIATGTGAGVGNRRQPQLFMKPGDTVEVEIDSIGVLRNSIVQESVT